MKNILVFGAGRSATALIDYILEQAKQHDWQVIVADADKELAESKVKKHPNGKAIYIDITKHKLRQKLISEADVVVSLLPVSLHYLVVHDCIKFRKHVVTASYLSNEMYGLEDKVREAAIMMVGEMGLDPGLDHMSAMRKINNLKSEGYRLESFKSFTGGLVAPESIDNPWKYKFTWNPKNVVLAGQGTAQYLKHGRYKYIPYNRVFRQTEYIHVEGIGDLEAYANRDSLLYKTLYGLDNIPTLIRGTLRYPGFCRAWDALVRIGLTDDSYPIIDSERMTYSRMVEAYLEGIWEHYPADYNVQKRLADFLRIDHNDEILRKLEWLGLFEEEKIELKNASPAQILLKLLLRKWSMQPEDRDMVVMQHEFIYSKEGLRMKATDTLVMKGEDSRRTAMAKLVGLPIGVFVKLIMLGKINTVGVHIPTIPAIYEPVLQELEQYGVCFKEKVETLEEGNAAGNSAET